MSKLAAVDVRFDTHAESNEATRREALEFLNTCRPMEVQNGIPLFIFQDGVSQAYYIKCSLSAADVERLCDLDARLDFSKPESYRANRELHLKNKTFLSMQDDANNGREFHDIVVEFSNEYNETKPLKVWGGQHRVKAISSMNGNKERHHGFRVYILLTSSQRTDLALVSNTSIAVSNDTFDRLIEETRFGNELRNWCQIVGLLPINEDFPDVGARSDCITVKKARSFIVNYYLGKEMAGNIEKEKLDQNIYSPYMPDSGVGPVDEVYARLMSAHMIMEDQLLISAGKAFANLHARQSESILKAKDKSMRRKAFRNKALVDSVITAWSFVAGLLEKDQVRKDRHLTVPPTNAKIVDPLNAKSMSEYHHEYDSPTYRGLGTRSSPKDRQRMAQVFLARTASDHLLMTDTVMSKAVSQVCGLISLGKGYSSK